ncbi:c-type cytochrome [Ramlibacter sp. AN1015]|uniref:c-type cytochrome n=1 Tax=Ramlibacter sp. AN1015 TaxID=3133428 RepID=UPI0030C1624D
MPSTSTRASALLPRSACAFGLLLLLGGCSSESAPMHIPGGDAQAGMQAIQRYGCVSCHTIPGLPGYGANVGPPLRGMGERAYVAGVIANTPENLVRWLQSPPEIDPRTAMPDLGVSEREARDIAAYLVSAH